MSKSTLWTAAVASLLLASVAATDPITGDESLGNGLQAASAAGGVAGTAATKADRRSARQAQKQATRLAKQCRKELQRAARKGTSVRTACRAPEETVLADTTDLSPGLSGPGQGTALGQIGADQAIGANGLGNGYGVGQGQPDSPVTLNLPPQAFNPNVSGSHREGDTATSVEVPEPATLALLGLGLLGLGLSTRRPRRS